MSLEVNETNNTIEVTHTTFTLELTETGIKGDKGDTGATGPTGPTGPAGADGADGADGVIQTIVAGTNITVDATDPANPIVSTSGSSVAWGSITGTLSAQTDLQTALDGKAASSHTHTESDITDLSHFTPTTIDSDYGNETVTSDWIFQGSSATGAFGAADLTVGDATNYGILQLGKAEIGRTSRVNGNMDLDGTVYILNKANPATSNILFALFDSTNGIRFAWPQSGTGNATYNPRSMIIAGPAVNDDTIVTVGYWQTQGIFHNLAMDTGTTGADLGVQNDLEVEGDIFTDSIKGSTDNTDITLDPHGTGDVVIASGADLQVTDDISTSGGAVLSDVIAEYTTANGVTVDGVLLKDGKVAGSALENAYPVGSIYMNATSSTNPATLLGFGTWSAFGAGRVLIGLDSGDTDFDTAEETGGSKTHTLTEAEMPSHTHSVTDSGHAHSTGGFSTSGGSGSANYDVTGHSLSKAGRNTNSATTGITLGNTGSGNAHTIVQPYIVVYMWKRTA